MTNIDMDRVELAARIANADEFVRILPEGYISHIGPRGSLLSGGQKLAITRALYQNSSILVLDEATSALDSRSELLLRQAVDRLMENHTVLVIAHRLETVLMADRIFLLQDGKVEKLTRSTFLAGHHDSLMSTTRVVVATKPKPKVEDGIFGTSEGIGFTKKNELFVEFVAINAPRLFGYCIYLKVALILKKTNGGCVFAKSQHATFNCMWQQKQLFDNLDAMLVEESLLLRTLESTHLNSCQNVKAAASRILGFIEEFIPIFKKSKCDVFIYVSCAQTALLDSKEFLAPVITPFEAILAFSRFFSYWGDKHRLLQLGSHSLWLNHSFVERLDLSKRILRGSIPMGRHGLTGDLPAKIGNCRGLSSIRIGNNKLVGVIPGYLEIFRGGLTRLNLTYKTAFDFSNYPVGPRNPPQTVEPVT
ncbi:hypothetical protein REPUB_Repub06bG0158200 [Reevesia pubescens]